jgi:hypothetical protein
MGRADTAAGGRAAARAVTNLVSGGSTAMRQPLAENSGRLSAMRPTKLTGRESHQGVKGAREVSLIREAHRQCDVDQQLLGALNQLPS